MYRTGQVFGAGHVIDVLRGKKTDRITHRGHNRLPTFNIGGELNEKEWRAVARQLVAVGCLISGDHGSLRLTVAAREVLRGEREIRFRKITPREKPEKNIRPPLRPRAKKPCLTRKRATARPPSMSAAN